MYEFRTLHDVILVPLKLHFAGSNFPEGDAKAVNPEPVIKSAAAQPKKRFFFTTEISLTPFLAMAAKLDRVPR